ncbi:hypothetical protein BSZ21_20685 [Bradyrhizobium canariense]|uniref:hypothetical protein n=1 Tax=Bradyrhizobium canariense TaxID=255045 RepID=UPI000A18B031|nr:hypothetical protein [Bradyrhizobium canariense]OSI65555.1 hypothetical protein BSZ21_20685 [Bradyrhizobium canariense]
MGSTQLSVRHVKDFLERLSAAISDDQAYVDSLPAERFSPIYDDGLWRTWRRDHRTYLQQLISTTDSIPEDLLVQLSEAAVAYDPAIVRDVVIDHLASIVGGCAAEDFSSVEHFFRSLC